ncbi:MAG: YraN family protein [Paracoccaceae bacterium]|nr:YraN family protein [Paracoccaceae bacterium]
MTGKTSYLAGLSAEEAVERHCKRRGKTILHRRWRGSVGEIDIIARERDQVIFIEVKKSKSFYDAISHLSVAQQQRIYATGSEYLANEELGQNTPVRFDVALVDSMGQIKVIENAIGF